MRGIKLQYWQWFVIVALAVSLYALVRGQLSNTEIALFSIVLIWLVMLQVLQKSSINSEKQGIFLLIRTERGKQIIRRIAGRERLWKTAGSFMVGASVVAMFFMLYSLVNALYLTYFQDTPAIGAKLLIPGVTIPFWYPLIALIIVVIVHEFSHGILSKAESISIKSLGAFFALAVPLGAFVEPEEEEFQDKGLLTKLRVYSAGSFANLLLAMIVSVTLLPLVTSLFFAPHGVQITGVVDGSPAEGVLEEGAIVEKIKGYPIENLQDFGRAIQTLEPGEEIEVVTEGGAQTITLTSREDDSSRGFIGIKTSQPVKEGVYSLVGFAPLMLKNLLTWVVFLNMVVGLVNLLPIHFGIAATDGHHIFKLSLSRFIGEERAESVSSMLSVFIALVIVFNLISPPG